MFIEVNKFVSIDDLIHGMLVQSGNDATVALAEHIAGDRKNVRSIYEPSRQRIEDGK